MAAGIYNFTIEQGATFERSFRYKNADGTAFDLQGQSFGARLQIKDRIGGTSIAYFSTSDGGSDLTISDTNLISLVITSTVTTDMDFETAVYDLEIFSASKVIRLLQGKVKLSKEVTTLST